MNNKGQVLVIFVILLPIFLLLILLVIDYGLLSIEKRKINNNTYDATLYYLNNIDSNDVKEKTTELLNSNLNNVEVTIDENIDYVEIKIKSNYKSLYNSIINGDINVKYKIIKENRMIIKG